MALDFCATHTISLTGWLKLSLILLDVVEIVQLVLDGGYNEIVDTNYDGTINVLDVIEIIQIILD